MTEAEFYAALNCELPGNISYIEWSAGDLVATLDGAFTPVDLRVIADILEKAIQGP